RIWTWPAAAPGVAFTHARLRTVLPRRARRRGLRRALDTAGRARTAMRQHALQRNPAWRAADVDDVARAAPAQAGGNRRGRARAGRRRRRISADCRRRR